VQKQAIHDNAGTANSSRKDHVAQAKEIPWRCDRSFKPRWESLMKTLIAISAATFMAASMSGASAATSEVRQPWCASVDGALNCVYRTLAECSQAARTEGNVCIPNPRPAVRK